MNLSINGRLRLTARAAFAAGLAVAAMGVPLEAAAQATTGSIYGQAQSGTTIVITNKDTGLKREVTANEQGRFSAPSLPPGTYEVTGVGESPKTVIVSPGIGTAVDLSAGGPVELGTYVVTGSSVSPIDVTTSQTSTVYSAEQLRTLPVAKDLTSVALLAPGTTRGDAAFGNLASFGGASVSENAYYINGFNVTNLFQNLTYSELPFYAISNIQLLTGGYGPEYGMSTGGVISVTSKKGTNEWAGGGAFTWEPDFLRENSPKTYAMGDHTPYRDYSDSAEDVYKYDLYAGGPLIKDTLFVYAIGEFTNTDRDTTPDSYGGGIGNFEELDREEPYWLAKVDWQINDWNLLEFTGISDRTDDDADQYSTEVGSDGFVNKADFLGTTHYESGGNVYIGKFTSNPMDELTLSAQYGYLKSDREYSETLADGTEVTYNGAIGDFDQPGCPFVSSSTAFVNANGGVGAPSCYLNSTIDAENGEDERKNWRADVSYRLDAGAAGRHTLAGGYEHDKWTTFYGQSYAGGSRYVYYPDYVRLYHFQTGADVEVETDSFYIKDDWQVTDTFLITAGVRNDSFKNRNGDGDTYVKQDDIWQPRVGFAWDVSGDSTKKLYGNFGVYSLPVAGTVAVRGASASYYTRQDFEYTAIDPVTGEPTLGAPISDVLYLNNEDGEAPNPESVASDNLDPTMQYEYILGYQMQFDGGWVGGLRAVYRNLDKTTDDVCDWRPLEAWAEENGVEYNLAPDTPGCFMINPGYAQTLRVDIDGDGDLDDVDLSADQIGLPKAKRKYLAFELTAEKGWSNQWYTQMSYTWAHNWGNAEGGVKSDIGQDDTGVTQDFDFPELMTGAYGDLPNDRRHTFKALGAYRPIPEVTVSAQMTLQTGRPENCFGYDAETDENFGYGSSYFYCGGQVTPRGSQGRTDTLWNLDLGATYEPNWLEGLSLQAKVFNVLDNSAVLAIEETGEVSAINPDTGSPYVDTTYGTPRSYQEPRYFQFTVQYDFTL